MTLKDKKCKNLFFEHNCFHQKLGNTGFEYFADINMTNLICHIEKFNLSAKSKSKTDEILFEVWCNLRRQIVAC